MKFRNTLLLIAVLAILAGYVYFFEIKKEDVPSEEDLAKVIFDLNVDDVLSVVVLRGEGLEEVAKVAREAGGSWLIEAPVQDVADHTKVDNTVARLTELEATRLLEEAPSDPTVYGLGALAWEFVMEMGDGAEHSLAVGDQNPTKSGYYVQRDDEPAVYLVGASVIRDISGWADNPPQVPTPTPAPAETPEPGAEPSPTPSS